MSAWGEYTRQAKMTLWTPAPADAPEIKGYRCYFRPEWLEWLITPVEIRVAAHGPATRATNIGQGEMWWSVDSTHPHRAPDRPDWLLLPVDLLAKARLGVERIEELRARQASEASPW